MGVLVLQSSVQKQRDGFEQTGNSERLFEKRLALPQHGAVVHQLIDVSGDVENRQIPPCGSNSANHLLAAEVGHGQIGQQQVQGCAAAEEGDRIKTAGRFGNLVPVGFENTARELVNRRLVVNNENGFQIDLQRLNPVAPTVQARVSSPKLSCAASAANSSTITSNFHPLAASSRSS